MVEPELIVTCAAVMVFAPPIVSVLSPDTSVFSSPVMALDFPLPIVSATLPATFAVRFPPTSSEKSPPVVSVRVFPVVVVICAPAVRVDVAEGRQISPRPADERQVHGFDLFIPAHGLDGMLPHCPGFRSDNGGRLLSGHNALPAFVFDTGLRFPAPVPVRVRTLEGGRRALPELFALRDGGQGYPERIDPAG